MLQQERNNPEGLSPCSHWEWVKHQIKMISRAKAKEIRIKNTEHEKDLTNKYQEIRKRADENLPYDEDSLRSYERELKEIQLSKACRAIERTKTKRTKRGQASIFLTCTNCRPKTKRSHN